MFLALARCVGLEQEGIFRLSGNSRVIERLKTLYEINCEDVEFDNEEDIMAIAGLMKLFLRELPDSVIPSDVVRQFLHVQAGELSLVLMQYSQIMLHSCAVNVARAPRLTLHN